MKKNYMERSELKKKCEAEEKRKLITNIFKPRIDFLSEYITRRYKIFEKIADQVLPVTFSPLIYLRIINFLLGLCFIPIIVYFYKENNTMAYIFIPFSFIPMYYWFNASLNKKLNFDTIITKDEFIIDNDIYKLNEIDEILVVSKPWGRGSKRLFLLIAQQMKLYRYEITWLASDRILSTLFNALKY